ncbi:pyruvate dehydrogenase (pyruvate oxidase), thiamin-dependent, FAD-binding [Legionella busanensis]|uniref:Pyruvate dehydrogenase (Pyruvate oxidase), thiamin-dependent, FAD-binding n=1 Tax=Legionella busanensis TaxID=190655 RepID=A0A378JN08_9GAMM|nr:thiamine pyrophosphate-binding protein [Legionella busanensis]STX51579.1 pyruvate dehydrogenase (pyruvate oxidase), thiamin-dependent, FAD-binding [Legionella busanensis]
MNIAEHICNYLALYQVRYIFGYPGAAILPLMEAIKNHPSLEWVLMRSESTAALAASAQGKLTKSLSVCASTCGPGVTNLLTGLLDAQLDHSPVLVISGLPITNKHSLGHFQSVDQLKLTDACCGFNAICENAAQVPQLLQTAVGYILRYNRPAHLAITPDLQLTKFTRQELKSARLHYQRLHRNIQLYRPPEMALDVVADTINSFKKIVIGVGARAHGAGKEIENFAEKICAPIISTFAGKGVIREDHSLYLGILGLFGAPANNLALDGIREAEVIITFGVDDLIYLLTDTDVDQTRELIQCEPNFSLLDYQFIKKRMLLGDIAEIALGLINKVNSHSTISHNINLQPSPPTKLKKETPFVSQELFFNKLNNFIDAQKTIIALDIGDSTVWATKYLKLKKRQLVLVSNRLGVMGFCLPALIAAKLTKPEAKVVGIIGDGALQMVLADLLTATQYDLNVIIIVFCNNLLQRVAAQQKDKYGVDLLNPDYRSLAKSCHITGIDIKNNNEIEEKLNEAFSISEGPILVAVYTDPTVFAPMSQWNN